MSHPGAGYFLAFFLETRSPHSKLPFLHMRVLSPWDPKKVLQSKPASLLLFFDTPSPHSKHFFLAHDGLELMGFKTKYYSPNQYKSASKRTTVWTLSTKGGPKTDDPHHLAYQTNCKHPAPRKSYYVLAFCLLIPIAG